MSTVMRARPREPKRRTAAWTVSKLFLFAAFVGLASAAYIAWQPVTNPGVQDCGSAVGFFLQNRENVILHPGEPGAPANAVALASQPSCRDLATVEMQKAGIGIGAFFLFGLLGVVIGLVDDRVEYWKAPAFESLLKPMPLDARIRHGLEPKVDVDELGSELPPLESPELWGLGLIGALTFVVLPFAGPVDATRTAWGAASLGPLLLGVVVTAALFLAAAVQRKAVYPGTDSWGRVVELVFAAAFAGRIRPLVGSFGIDIHHLRKTGLRREDAVLDVQVLQTVSLAAHVALIGAAALVVRAGDRPRVDFDTPQLVLLGVVVLVLLSSLQRLARRIRALPVRPGIAGLRGIGRVTADPAHLAFLLTGTVAVSLAGAVVLQASLAMFGASAPFATLLFTYLVAVTAGALSTTPDGVGVLDATLALLLMRFGVEPGAAISAALVFRLLTLWFPLLVGWRATRRLEGLEAL